MSGTRYSSMSAGSADKNVAAGFLGWLDFSHEARKRVAEALNALNEKGAVDELGFGVLRDAFAEALFPGTSTLHTRAKYFVLVPCCIRLALERGQSLRRIEQECCRQMWNACYHSQEAGVIGRRGLDNGAEWIQRPPSEIYWAGMRKLGILRTRTPSGLWFARAARLAAEAGQQPGSRKREEGIDDDSETDFSGWKRDFDFRLWKDIYHEFLDRWGEQTLIPDLTPAEAAFLRDCILGADGTRETLLAWCLKQGRIPRRRETDESDAPPMENQSQFYRFSQSVRRHVPPKTGTLLDAANAFNRLVFPARVLHNKLLCVPGIDAAGIWSEIKGVVPGWANSVNLPTMFALFPGHIPASLITFLEGLKNAFRKGDFGEAERLIRKREIAVKGDRAKALHPEKLDPGKWVGGGWLDFRLANAGRILRDIAEQTPEPGGSNA